MTVPKKAFAYITPVSPRYLRGREEGGELILVAREFRYLDRRSGFLVFQWKLSVIILAAIAAISGTRTSDGILRL